MFVVIAIGLSDLIIVFSLLMEPSLCGFCRDKNISARVSMEVEINPRVQIQINHHETHVQDYFKAIDHYYGITWHDLLFSKVCQTKRNKKPKTSLHVNRGEVRVIMVLVFTSIA